jgi:hypothetical protein
MKIIINIFLYISLMFLLSNCSNLTSPTENIVLKKGTYSGTFSVTFKNYKNYSYPVTQTGTISILFADSIYNYSAKINYSSDSISTDSLKDFGRYSIQSNKIIINDISWWRMDPHWHNGLYLENTFNIENIDGRFRIFQDNSFAQWDLNLVLNK